MNAEQTAAVVRRPEQVRADPLAPGVTVTELLTDQQGCRGLRQRLLRVADGAGLAGTAQGRGEAWYVTRGSGTLDTGATRVAALRPGTAVWMRESVRYRCRARPSQGPPGRALRDRALPDQDLPGQDLPDQGLEILAVVVRAGSPGDDGRPEVCVTSLQACEPERTGDREFRVLLSAGLAITQFAGLIPPGRAPEHRHAYDEVVHVLAGHGVVHLAGAQTGIGPGTSIYLAPQMPHCLENLGPDPLEVLGVFYPAGSPAAKQATEGANG